MKQKVVTWDIQEHIQDLMKEYPATKEYFAWVAELLNCSIETRGWFCFWRCRGISGW